jgi:hypothetical protein
MTSKSFVLAIGCLIVSSVIAQDRAVLEEGALGEKLRAIDSTAPTSEKILRAKEMTRVHWLSSLQVKAVASRLPDDAARLDFALAAYPRTLDPENFYEVYDAFASFSKVFRLHDRIRALAGAVPVAVEPRQRVTPGDFKNILRTLRDEPFEPTRMTVAKQIFSTSKGAFLAGQVKQILETFTFEPSRLEFAKFAYRYTADPENYFVVNEAFVFSPSKQELASYIESLAEAKPAKK